MRNVSDKNCRENQKTCFVFRNFLSNRAAYEIMWKNNVQPDRPQMKIWSIGFECWITKVTDTQAHIIFNTYCFYTTTMVRLRLVCGTGGYPPNVCSLPRLTVLTPL
jgi:hypothetical protein